MKVAAFTTSQGAVRLTRTFPPGTLVKCCTHLDEVRRQLDGGEADVGWIDVSACSGELDILSRLLSRHGRVVIVDLRLDPASIRTVVALLPNGVRHVIYRETDDVRTVVTQTLHEIQAAKLGARVVAALQGPLDLVAPKVRTGIGQLFADPLRFHRAADIAEAIGMARRSLDRALQSVGLEPARTFLLASRVTWAYTRMRDENARVRDLARAMGLSKPERFTRHTRRLVGLPPSALRADVSQDELVALIVARLRRDSGCEVGAVRSRSAGCSVPVADGSSGCSTATAAREVLQLDDS